MKRRGVLRRVGTVSCVGLLASSGTVGATPSEISEISLPEGEARGLGSRNDVFLTTHRFGRYYYVTPDGSIDTRGEVDYYLQAGDFGPEAAYLGHYRLIKYPYGTGSDPVERELPDNVLSMTYDDTEGRLWAGGENGKVWKLSDTLAIEQTYDFSGGIFGLAHDGEFLWVGDSDRGRILQYDPEKKDTAAIYDYPTARTYYDYTYADGHLWLLGDDTIYETDIDASVPTPTPTATATPTPTPTPEPTDSPTPTETRTRTETRTDARTRTDTTSSSRQQTTPTATEGEEIRDSDGDGMIDAEDYAPQDPEVQQKSDLGQTSGSDGPGFGFLSAVVAGGALLTARYLHADDD